MSKNAWTLSLALVVLRVATAQQDPSYPTWVTNDYPCVIKCMEDQFANAQPPATDDKVAAAMGCVRDACSKDTAQGNVYQAHYIINMFNTIGSIYEPQSWQDGNAPDAKDLVAPTGWTQTQVTTTWTENDQPTTITTSVWAPPATNTQAAQPAETTSAAAAPTSASGAVVESKSVVHSSSTAASASASRSGNASTGGNGTGNGSGRIEPLNMGLSVLFSFGVVSLAGFAGGVGLLGL